MIWVLILVASNSGFDKHFTVANFKTKSACQKVLRSVQNLTEFDGTASKCMRVKDK